MSEDDPTFSSTIKYWGVAQGPQECSATSAGKRRHCIKKASENYELYEKTAEKLN